jgi:hypothetical protein
MFKVRPKRVSQIQEAAPRNGPLLSKRLDPRGHESEQRLLVNYLDGNSVEAVFHDRATG